MMRLKETLFAAALSLFISYARAQAPGSFAIIPKPVSIHAGTGRFLFNNQTHLVAKNSEERKIAQLFNYYFNKKIGRLLPIRNTAGGNAIVLNVKDEKSKSEDYDLNVAPGAISISGSKDGVFYGMISLLQIITKHGALFAVPAVSISDRPNFTYRGLMVDVSRHFFSVDEIKKLLDVMAYLKLNRFHWHLTDDQGWRLEIKKYPKLTAISAWRDSTIIGNHGDFKPFIYDGVKSGGFYTQQEARDVVKYAAERNITVIPEIEMPGHSTAVLAAYPELGNGGTSYQVPGYFGVHSTIYNPGEKTFEFLQNVLVEVIDIFPSKYIHVGGDEVPKDEWKSSSAAQKIIADNNLKNEHELQSWFISRIEKFLNAKGRSLIGWDEILEGGLAPNATVMSWRGEQGGIEAAQQKHNVIMTPGGYMYIDHYQAKDNKAEPLAIGGFLPLKTVYNYHPVPAVLKADEQKYIMGVQANMWTEYIPTNEKLEYMIFPRRIAAAEVGWTKPENKNFDDFAKIRLPKALSDIDLFKINYRIPEAEVTVNSNGSLNHKMIKITPYTADSKIYYTLDGHKADNTATLYQGPITVPYSNGRPLTLRYIIVNGKGRNSGEYTFNIEK